MTTEAVSIRMTIGGTTYTLDEVIDTADTFAAMRVSKGVAHAIIAHVGRCSAYSPLHSGVCMNCGKHHDD